MRRTYVHRETRRTQILTFADNVTSEIATEFRSERFQQLYFRSIFSFVILLVLRSKLESMGWVLPEFLNCEDIQLNIALFSV